MLKDSSKVSLTDVRKVYREVVQGVDNKMAELNLTTAIYASMVEVGIDLYERKREFGISGDRVYYFIETAFELNLFKEVALRIINSTNNTKEETTAEETTKDKDSNIYLFVKMLNRINSIYLKTEDKKKFEDVLLREFTKQSKNVCNLYNRNARDIKHIKSYIENQNDFIINLATRLTEKDTEYIKLAVKSTKEILKIA